jgi:hypothetical protein
LTLKSFSLEKSGGGPVEKDFAKSTLAFLETASNNLQLPRRLKSNQKGFSDFLTMATEATRLSSKQRAARTPSRLAASARGGRKAAEIIRQQRNLNLAAMSDREAHDYATANMTGEEKQRYRQWVADHRDRLANEESV